MNDERVQIIAPDRRDVYAVAASDLKKYEAAGFTRYTGSTVDEGSILNQVAGWRNKAGEYGQAAGLGALDAVPFASTAITNLASPETAKAYAGAVQESREEHPYVFGAGQLAGGAAVALGTAGLGELALGAAAARGVAGAGALRTALAASPVARAAVTGATQGAAFSAAHQVDVRNLEAAQTPEGQERTTFSVGNVILDASLGGLVGAGLAGALKGATAVGRRSEKWGEKLMLDHAIDSDAQKRLLDAGRQDILDYAKTKLATGGNREEILRSVGDDAHLATTSLNRVSAAMGNARIEPDEFKDVMSRLAGHLMDPQFPGVNTPAHDAIKPLTAALQRLNEAATPEELAKAARTLPTYNELTKATQGLDELVRYKNVKGDPSYERARVAARDLRDVANRFAGRVHGPEMQKLAESGNSQYSLAAGMVDNLGSKELESFKNVASTAARSAVFAGGLASVGVIPGTVLGAAGKGAFFSTVFKNTGYTAGGALSWLGKSFKFQDKTIARAIKLGLAGTPVLAMARHDMDYDDMAARVLTAARNPVSTMANLKDALSDKGLTDAVADPVAQRGMGILAAGAQQLPKRAGTPDAVTLAKPDPVAQRKWLGYMNSALDPAYALSNPTVENMDAAKRFHPETMQRAQQAISDHVLNSPRMSHAARAWAAQVLGRPVDVTTSPEFFRSLTERRAQSAQGAGGAQGPQPSGAGAQKQVQSQGSGATRLEELSAE